MNVAASAVATAVSVALAARLLAEGVRRRRPHLLCWGISLALFAIGCAALLWGAVAHWTPSLFRTYYLCGAVLTVPILGLGSVWLLAPRAAKGLTIVVGAFSLVAAVVVLTAATKAPVPADRVPEGKELFKAEPRVFAVLGNVAGTLLVVGGTAISAVRVVRRRRAGTTTELDGRYLQANLLIAAGTLVAASGGLFLFLGESASKAVPLALAAILIFAGYARSRPGRIPLWHRSSPA
jgi:hypothetical protein